MLMFTEKQKFAQWWIWVVLIGVTVLCIWGAVQQLVFKIPFGNKPAPDQLLIFICLVPLVPLALFWFMALETEIDEQGVSYQFKPLHLKKRFIAWNEITEAYVREYKPLKEYGGWGIRGSFRNGKAYNVSGNKGLQLVLKNGKKILLGTNKSDELTAFLMGLKK
jgi:hypothetical protein